MFEGVVNFFNKMKKKDTDKTSMKTKDAAQERLHLVLMQDRANVSADFMELMKQEIIDVIKKYIDIDEKEIDVKLTNKPNSDGTTGAPILYANIPIVSIKNESRIAASEMKEAKKEEPEDVAEKEEIPETVEEIADEDNQEEAEESPEEENVAEKEATKKA